MCFGCSEKYSLKLAKRLEKLVHFLLAVPPKNVFFCHVARQNKTDSVSLHIVFAYPERVNRLLPPLSTNVLSPELTGIKHFLKRFNAKFLLELTWAVISSYVPVDDSNSDMASCGCVFLLQSYC